MHPNSHWYKSIFWDVSCGIHWPGKSAFRLSSLLGANAEDLILAISTIAHFSTTFLFFFASCSCTNSFNPSLSKDGCTKKLIAKKSLVALHSSSTHQESCKSSNPQRELVPVILPIKLYRPIAAVALGVCPQIRQILLQLICEIRWGHRRRLYCRCKSIASNTQHHDDEQNRWKNK